MPARLTMAVIATIGIAVGMIGAAPALADQPVSVAVFDVELIDTSLEGELAGVQPAEVERLAMISRQLRRDLGASGKFIVVDVASAAEAISASGNLYGCNACAADIAGSLGADLALTGTIQKVSSLILNINIFLIDVAEPETVRAASVDIRGNTDESWSRGVSYLIRNRLLSDR